MLKSKITAKGSSNKDSLTGCLIERLSSGVSEHSLIQDIVSFTEELRMSLPPDSHVNHSALQENEKAKTIPAISGLKQSPSFAWYDRDTHSLRTSQTSLLSDTCPKFSATWPKSGMMLDGWCWALTMWEPTIDGKDCGLWPTPVGQDDNKSPEAHMRMKARMKGGPRKKCTSLQVMVKGIDQGRWPTPTGGDHNRGMTMPDGKRGQSLVGAARGQMWPSARATDGTKGTRTKAGAEKELKRGRNIDLGVAVKMWPTPHGFTKDGKSHGPSGNELGHAVNRSMWPTPTDMSKDGSISRGGKRKNELLLAGAVKKFPTPSSSMMTDADMNQARFAGTDKNRPDYKDAGTGSLNPPWVEWLMGWPIGWTDLKPLETGKFQKWLRLHGKC